MLGLSNYELKSKSLFFDGVTNSNEEILKNSSSIPEGVNSLR